MPANTDRISSPNRAQSQRVVRWLKEAPASAGGVLGHFLRLLLAAPFVLSFLLTLALGPATINSVHGSFAWLAAVSLAAALLLLGVKGKLLIPASLATFLVFPPMAGLGFNFAPA